MSTQVLENQTEKVTELNAEAVKNVLSFPPSQQAKRDYSFAIRIFEHAGTAHIAWSLDHNYAMGPEDVLQLRDGSRFLKNMRPSSLTGDWDTGHPYGSGLNASYWAWNYVGGSADWRQLVVTPNT